MSLINLRPPRIAQVLFAVAAVLHFLTPLGNTVLFANSAAGVLFGGAGFGVMMWGWAVFRRLGAAVDPRAPVGTLVTSGPYRFSRNPMYLGMMGIMVGFAVYFGTFPFFFATLTLFVILNFAFCPYEEGKLRAGLGEPYRLYSQRVRRWV